MGLAKTVALVIVAGAAGSMISNVVTPKVVALSPKLSAQASAIGTGMTAGSAALVYVVLAHAL